MRFGAALLAALAVFTLTSTALAQTDHRPLNCGKMQPRNALHCARAQLHKARRELKHSTTRHSPGYWHWRVKVTTRWIRQAKYRLQHPPIAHLALWLCIHNYEGSWNNADTGQNGHYGGLQMTSPWGAGVYYVYRADWLTPYEQMRKAELGYRASGYSYGWLLGQWYHPDCAYAYAVIPG